MYEVREGDTLWAIAMNAYGEGSRYADILAANPGVSCAAEMHRCAAHSCCVRSRSGLAEALSEAGSGLDAGAMLRLPPP
jgi:hypothetical protein